MRILSSFFYFYKRKIATGFDVDKLALVVDIGSGDKPFWRADVFVDDLSLRNVQRASETMTIHDIGIFVNANVNKLPFKNKAFDFSFCSHLLEHVEDPKKAVREITRVSKTGYIEMPNGIIETVQPFVSHLWFVYRDKNKLIFVRKSKKMHDALIKNGKNFFSTINKAPDPFIRMYWKNNIDVEIVDDLKEKEKYYAPINIRELKKKRNKYAFFIKLIRLIFHKNKKISISQLKK